MKNTGIEHSVEIVYFPRVRDRPFSPHTRDRLHSLIQRQLSSVFVTKLSERNPGMREERRKSVTADRVRAPGHSSVLMPKRALPGSGSCGAGVPLRGWPDHVHPPQEESIPLASQSAMQLRSVKSPPAVLDCLSFTVWTDCRLPSDGHPLRAHGIRHQGVRLRIGGAGTRVWAPSEESFPRHSLIFSQWSSKLLSFTQERRMVERGVKETD